MAAVDDDIRNDFLAEAGELLERLGPQLVELEQQPEDPALLNAIFRAFHTVKGGAGFLNETALVALCHRAEEIFSVLRAGTRRMDAGLMDTVLAAYDEVLRMMETIRAGNVAAPAPAALLQQLKDQLQPPVAVTMAAPAAEGEGISDDEFEALLDQLQGKPTAAAPPPNPPPLAPEHQQRRASDQQPDASVRIDTVKLDAMMNLVGELVLLRNRLKVLHAGSEGMSESDRAVRELDALTSRLQGALLSLRMQPIKKVFSRFPKLVRDLARQLGKEINVVMEGEDTDLDKNLVEALADPLVHMVRNSCDHGVELPAARLAAGKPAAGMLTLSAAQRGGQIHIRIADDGAGIDAARLRRKVVEKGLMTAAAAEALSEQAALELIFMPGFSTKDQVSDLSGRGVGMDVVKSSIGALNGSVQLQSTLGQGSCFTLRLPLTLAIVPALMVVVADRRYAIALPAVAEVAALDARALLRADPKPQLRLREEALPLIDLHRWVSPQATVEETLRGECQVVVVQVDGLRHGLVVTRVLGREEVVVKPLGALLKGLPGFAGATITGEGQVALIIDLPSLIQQQQREV